MAERDMIFVTCSSTDSYTPTGGPCGEFLLKVLWGIDSAEDHNTGKEELPFSKPKTAPGRFDVSSLFWLGPWSRPWYGKRGGGPKPK